MEPTPFKATSQLHGLVRLLKLATFMEMLEPAKFHYGELVSVTDGKCGTVCCALGWTPAVFPQHWRWIGDNIMRFGERAGDHDFFAISSHDDMYLFYNGSLMHREMEGTFGPRDWARHCREFVVNKEPSLAAILEPAPVSGMERILQPA